MTQEQIKLEQRITNLEIALQGMWALIEHLQPPATQNDVKNMLLDHFEASSKLGGFKRIHF